MQGTKNILDASWGRTVEDNLNYTAVWEYGDVAEFGCGAGDVEWVEEGGPTQIRETVESFALIAFHTCACYQTSTGPPQMSKKDASFAVNLH